MDFIPFNSSSSNRNKALTPQTQKMSSQKNSPSSNSKKSSYSSPGMPAFGSPAVNFNFGAPAVQSSGFYSQNRTPSPRHHDKQYSQQRFNNSMSPRGHNGFNNKYRNQQPSASPYSLKDSFNNSCSDNFRQSGDFKSPNQFSVNRGRGNGRNLHHNQYNQKRRNFINRGSLCPEDYYHSSMIEDPWCRLSPVLITT
ncbi:hypothetical protein ACF0H5_018486 [Mactra antiquata]